MTLADDLSLILDTRDLATLDQTTGRLPGVTEGTLPGVLGKNVANGLAALNGVGVPVDTSGNAMARIGTTSGTAADAAAVTAAISTAVGGRLATTGGTITGPLVVPTPTLSTQAATKGYVDGVAAPNFATALAGSRYDIPCPGGVQPNRPSARTDIFFDWLMIAEPSQAAGKAIPGDGWRVESW